MRKKVHTSLEEDLYANIQSVAKKYNLNACDLLEIGMKQVLTIYERGELNERVKEHFVEQWISN